MWYNEILGNRNKTLHLVFSYWASLWYYTKKSLISFKSYNNVDTTHQRLLGHVMHVNVNHVELCDTLLPGNLHVNCPTNANTFSENEYTILTMLVCRYCSLLSSYVSGKGEILGGKQLDFRQTLTCDRYRPIGFILWVDSDVFSW